MDFLVNKLTLFVLVCSLQADLSSCTAVAPEILEGPVTLIVPITQNKAHFTCRASANILFWRFNDQTLWEDQLQHVPCVSLPLYPEAHVNTMITKRIDTRVTQQCNGTKVECVASGDNAGNVISSPAFLYIAVAPSQPDPVVTTLNKTALQVSWSESNSQDGFPVLSYTLNIQNLTSSSLIDMVIFSDTNASSFQYVFTVDSVLSECHTISVEVTANNSVGGSSPGVATGGFPIVLGGFLLPTTVEVTFTTDLSPRVSLSFTPPRTCWFQEATYQFTLFNGLTRARILTSREGTYNGGETPTIMESYETGIEKDKDYEAVVAIRSITGTTDHVVQFNTSINISPQAIPQLTIVNSTAISVQWNRSFTFSQDMEIGYTLVIRNETDEFHLGEEVFNVSANFNSYPMFYVYNSDGHISTGCHNISFTIFASNSFGESERPARAVTGFPIDPSNFSTTLQAIVSFTANLEPKLEVTFEHPSICWYQSGTYNIQILNDMGNVDMSVGPRQYRGSGNPHITEKFQSGLLKGRVYRVIVTVESFGESVQAEKPFSTILQTESGYFITVTEALESSESPGLDIGLRAGIAVGCCLILALVLAISIVCIIILYLRRKKRKAERLRRPPVPDIPNLFYESAGPIYDEIPGESFAKLKSTVPSTPCSEYVTIEGKLNGDIDRYDQSHTSDKDFEKPLSLTTCTLGPKRSSFPTGEDAYTLMNPAGAACISKGQASHDHSPHRISAGSHTPIGSRHSLPLVSQRVGQQESESGNALEERYVRTSSFVCSKL